VAVAAGAVAAFLAYSLVVPHLGGVGDTAAAWLVGIVGMPLVALAALSHQGLRVVRWRWLAAALVAAALVAVAASRASLPAEASTAKIVAASLIGLLAVLALTSPLEAALVAVLIIGVDAYSVFAGPTKAIITHHPGVLSAFTIRVPGPGERFAELGVTDVFFLSLLAAAAQRFGLRVALTWTLMGLSLSASYALAYWLDRPLPALPLLAAAFLVPNADLLRAQLRLRL
jgi:hypothetical protein